MGRTLGLDLGGTNIKLAILESGRDVEPRILATSTVPTGAEDGPDAVTERIIRAGRRMIDEHGPVRAAGVGVPGLFDRATGAIVLFPNLPGPWPGHPFRDPISAGLGVPVAVINDARAFTLAEGTVGAGRGARTLICVTLGTGVGGGLMIDGRLHLGPTGTAGEIGHQVVLPDGPACGCGNRGCVEPLVQAEALIRLAGRTSVEAVYRGVREGDARCADAVATTMRYLGIGLANVMTVLVADRIVVGGGIASAGDLLLEPLRAAVRTHAPLVPPGAIDIRVAALGAGAGAIGAALAAVELGEA